MYARLLKKLAAGGWGSHVISEERRKRDTNAEKADIMADLRQRKVRVIAAPNQWHFPRRTRMQPISNLTTTAGKKMRPRYARQMCRARRLPAHRAVPTRREANRRQIRLHRPRGPRPQPGRAVHDPRQRTDAHRGRTDGQGRARRGHPARLGRRRRRALAVAHHPVSHGQAATRHAGPGRARRAPRQNEAALLHLLTGRPAADSDDDGGEALRTAYAALISKDTPARLHRHTVAYLVLDAETDAQRVDPTKASSWGGQRTARWLRLLAQLGYDLSDAEQVATTTWPEP